MRYFILALAMSISSLTAVAQSKKELVRQVEELKQEITRLQNEIADLKKPKVVTISGELQEVSYGLGILMASNVQSQGVDTIDVDVLAEGFKDVFNGDSLQQDQQKSMMVVQSYMERAYEKKAEKMREGNVAFFNQNRTKAGVKETASGLQYEVVKSGNGKTPGPNDQVTVHYTGKLLDGTVFDSSIQSGKPATFGVSQVIPGWTEALQLMKEGDKFILYIPDELAYGERGAGGRIPPYSPLIFEVELIKVN